MIDASLVTALALLIALISLDQTAVGQFMIYMPLAGGWLMGLALGDPLGGLMAGALLQFLCCLELPVGASIPPDGSLAGLVGVALYLTAPRPPHWGAAAMLGLAVVLFYPLASLSRGGEVYVRRLNRHWTTVAEAHLAGGRYGLAQLASLGGIPLFFGKAFLISWTALWFVPLLLRTMPLAGTEFLEWPLFTLGRIAPFVGLGIMATSQRQVRPVKVLAFGFLLGSFLTWSAQ